MKKIIALLVVFMLLATMFSCSEPNSDPTPMESSEKTTTTDQAGDNRPLPQKTEVDLFLFMGGANMSGRGNAAESATYDAGHAFEFKAVSDPTKLYPMTAGFGNGENLEHKISDTEQRTGGLVPAFCEAYYQATQTPIVAVSCSEGNTASSQWTAGKGKLEDAISRMETAQDFLKKSETYTLRHTYAVWLQGEADGDYDVDPDVYVENIRIVSKTLLKRGVKKMFLIQIGNHAESELKYRNIQDAQRTICSETAGCVLVSDMLFKMDSHLHDGYLYDQETYDLIGADAGKNAGIYVLNPDSYVAPDHREHEFTEDNQFDGTEIELPPDLF